MASKELTAKVLSPQESKGLVQDVADIIVAHVVEEDKNWNIFNIELQLSNQTRSKHTFQLRMKDYEIYLVDRNTGMKMDLSEINPNVELWQHNCGTHLNIKNKKVRKELETYLQLILNSCKFMGPPRFNGKQLRSPDDISCDADRQYNFCVHKQHYDLFVEDVIRLCIGFKLGYF